jgi:hypothetical protein
LKLRFTERKKKIGGIENSPLTKPIKCAIIQIQRERNKTSKTKGDLIMKYRAYNEQNICHRTGIIFATYFRTKREAVAHAEKIGGNAKVERKIGDTWVAY